MSDFLSAPPTNAPITTSEGNATSGFANWLTALWNRTGGISSSIFSNDSSYIIREIDSALPNAQALQTLPSGFLKVTTGTGILSSTGTAHIQTTDLSPTGVIPGKYGNLVSIPIITVNAQGQITIMDTTPILPPTVNETFSYSFAGGV